MDQNQQPGCPAMQSSKNSWSLWTCWCCHGDLRLQCFSMFWPLRWYSLVLVSRLLGVSQVGEAPGPPADHSHQDWPHLCDILKRRCVLHHTGLQQLQWNLGDESHIWHKSSGISSELQSENWVLLSFWSIINEQACGLFTRQTAIKALLLWSQSEAPSIRLILLTWALSRPPDPYLIVAKRACAFQRLSVASRSFFTTATGGKKTEWWRYCCCLTCTWRQTWTLVRMTWALFWF